MAINEIISEIEERDVSNTNLQDDCNALRSEKIELIEKYAKVSQQPSQISTKDNIDLKKNKEQLEEISNLTKKLENAMTDNYKQLEIENELKLTIERIQEQ